MTGTKRISDLITKPDALLQGRINIIDAGVSAGKTYFALTQIPKWSSPEKILYLIDTTNGELRIQNNILTEAIGRDHYSFCDYNTGKIWGEKNDRIGKMPVMTYSGFGAEVRKNKGDFHWLNFDYIICDEMQNLFGYQKFDKKCSNLVAAETALSIIAAEKEATIVAMSATPQKIRERFGELCYDVPFDHNELQALETFSMIPYKKSVLDLLFELKGKTGILFTTNVRDMMYYIEMANSMGIAANGFWSTSLDTQKKYPHTQEQTDLREMVLGNETIPENIDLLVINRASETCIKIKEENRKVDFMIVNNCNEEIKTQVRGRYHGDLAEFYYHDIVAANLYQISKTQIPGYYFGKRLYAEEQNELFRVLNLQKPNGIPYGKDTIWQVLSQCGYQVSESKKDSKNHGKHYRVISSQCTNLNDV